MCAYDYGVVVFFCNEVKCINQSLEVFFVVDVFFAVGGDDEVFFLFETEACEDIGGQDLGHIVVQDLIHGAAGFDDAVGRDAFAQQVLAGDATIREVDVGDVVNDFAVGFFGHALVKAAVAGFHVEDGDVALLGGNGTEAAVGIAKDQEGIWFDFFEDRVDINKDLANRCRGGCSGGVEEVVGFADAEVFVEDFVELVVVVLAGVDGDVFNGIGGIEGGHDAGEADDLGTGADDGEDF